jgi:hypothetical protein
VQVVAEPLIRGALALVCDFRVDAKRLEPARYAASMAYDNASRGLVLHDGSNGEDVVLPRTAYIET